MKLQIIIGFTLLLVLVYIVQNQQSPKREHADITMAQIQTDPGTLPAKSSGITRTELQRHDLSMEGREMVHVRIDFDPGTYFGNHTHFGEEIIYVIEGLLEYEVEGKLPVTLKAGEVLFIPAGTIHSARNVGLVNAAELATYIVEKGKPIVAVAE